MVIPEEEKLTKVVIIDVVPEWTATRHLPMRIKELTSLVETLWWVSIEETIQKKTRIDYKTFIGTWKLEEVIELMKDIGAEVLIIGNAIKPRQLYTINEALRPIKAQCRDRVDLILKIFDQHAVSTESKLQIELAAIKHMWPRIVGMGMELSRQAGWIGTSGIGETNTEIMRRHLQKRRLGIVKKLRDYEKMRKLHREGRRKRWLKTIWLVGYTNAGKSTLLTSLTNKDAYAEDELFATLGTQVASMRYYPEWVYKPAEILISDTIGFIRELPPKLIEAFKSTLEDSIESDILLHVIDASDRQVQPKVTIVNDILDNIGASQKRIYIFNKIDQITAEEKIKLKELYSEHETFFVSATEKSNIDELKTLIITIASTL